MRKNAVRRLFKGYHYPMYVYRDTHGRGGFTLLSLDLTSRCNYRCDWCFNQHLISKTEENSLTLNEIIKLLKIVKRLGVKTLVIPGTGEPTLDKNFCEIVKIAKNLGLITVVYSNLTGNLDKEKIKFLFDHNVSVGIKLDSFDPECFKKRYCADKESFSLFKDNLAHIIEVYKKSKERISYGLNYQLDDNDSIFAHRIIANMVLTLENRNELESVADFCEKNDLPLFVRPVKPVLWAKNNLDLWKKIGNPTGELFPDRRLIYLANDYNQLFSPSSTLEDHCAIYTFGLTVKNNGDLQVCPDHHNSRGKMGNIRDKNIDWRNLVMGRKVMPKYCVMFDRETP